MKNLLFVFCLILFCSNGIWGQFIEKQLIVPKLPSGQDRILADMDRDGDKDMLMIGKYENMILWIENEGLGKFGGLTVIDNQPMSVNDIDIGDFNNDGYIDIVAVLEENNILQWYAGSENNIFALKRTLCSSCEGLNTVNTGDFDGDGDIDIVAAQAEQLFWFDNDGTGNFAPRISIIESNKTIDYVKTVDIDKNGKEDILYGSSYGANYLIRHAFNQEFEEIQQLVYSTSTSSLSTDIESSYFRDINQDGHVDWIVKVNDIIKWYENNGNGMLNLSNPHNITEASPAHLSEHIGVVDVNTDGNPDVLWTEFSVFPEAPPQLRWSKNLGNGIFETQDPQPLLEGYFFGLYPTFQAFDFSEDGQEDFLLGDMWFENQSAQFDILQPNFISHSMRGLKKIQLADMNNDSRLDLIALGEDFFVWIEANPDGRFGVMHLFQTPYYTTDARDFIIEDIDKDGRSDVICLFGGGSISAIYVFLQKEAGNFELLDIPNIKPYPAKIQMIDIDDDNDLDMLVTHDNSGLWMHENQGNNQFHSPVNLNEDAVPNAIIQDFNNDGKLDLVMLASDKFIWYEQNVDGLFNIQHTIDPIQDNDYKKFVLADVDQDGQLDIVYTTFGSVGWLRITGEETYEYKYIDIVYDVFEIIVKDVDNDGDMDIRLFSSDNPTVVDYIDAYSDKEIFPISSENEVSIQMLDMDGDTDEDIIVAYANYINASKITYFESIKSEAQIHCTAFFDENENGIFDEGERPFQNQKITLSPNAVQTFTDETGKTVFHINPGMYELGYIPNPLWKLTTAEESYQILIDENYEIFHYFFGFAPTRITHRVQPNLTSARTRCSEAVPFWLNYVNVGTTRANGHISLDADSLLNFLSAEPTPDYEEDGKLFWEIKDIYPYEERRIELMYQIPSSQFTGHQLQLQARVELFAQNEQMVYFKNTEYTPIVRCSFDPNDKLAQTEQYGTQEIVWKQDSLYYTIRFQNTGNDFARDVRITDFLDKNLDWTTFNPLTSSHDMETTLDRNTGEITFLFEDILLPDSTTNEPKSHGFVTYSIAPISNIEDKTEINNTAFIYFDFNTPIITNTTSHITTDDPATSIALHEPQLYLNIYPNPTKDHWHIHLQYPTHQNYRLKLLDVTGKLLQSYTGLQNGTNFIERKGLQSGVYFLQLEGEAGTVLGMGKLLVE